MTQQDFAKAVNFEIARMVKAAEVAANDDLDLCPWCARTGDEIFACCGDMSEAA